MPRVLLLPRGIPIIDPSSIASCGSTRHRIKSLNIIRSSSSLGVFENNRKLSSNYNVPTSYFDPSDSKMNSTSTGLCYINIIMYNIDVFFSVLYINIRIKCYARKVANSSIDKTNENDRVIKYDTITYLI